MKVQSVSQLSSITIDDILSDSTLSAVVEVSRQEKDSLYYHSKQFDFKDMMQKFNRFINDLNGQLSSLSIWVDENFVHLSGNETIYGDKTFVDTLSAGKIAELSARHALWS